MSISDFSLADPVHHVDSLFHHKHADVGVFCRTSIGWGFRSSALAKIDQSDG
jgi:hypothetical protein